MLTEFLIEKGLDDPVFDYETIKTSKKERPGIDEKYSSHRRRGLHR